MVGLAAGHGRGDANNVLVARPTISVEGIAELRRALKAAGEMESLAEFRDGLKAAAEIVAKDARSRVVRRSGRAADSIRATAGGNRVFVRGGKSTVPYYGWLDFGSRTPISGRPRSVGPWARSGAGPRGGRFIYPAVERNEDRVVEALDRAVRNVLRDEDLI